MIPWSWASPDELISAALGIKTNGQNVLRAQDNPRNRSVVGVWRGVLAVEDVPRVPSEQAEPDVLFGLVVAVLGVVAPAAFGGSDAGPPGGAVASAGVTRSLDEDSLPSGSIATTGTGHTPVSMRNL